MTRTLSDFIVLELRPMDVPNVGWAARAMIVHSRAFMLFC